MKKIIQDLNFGEIKSLVLSLGEREFRAKQLFDGLLQAKPISKINIPAQLKERLLEDFEDEPVKICETLTSEDGTKKFLFSLADGNVIEGVLMSYKYGNTQCVSTQVGCRMGCKFCASTLQGLIRNLTSGEILSQILVVNAAFGGTKKARAVTNVVLMGSGEPLDNYDEVVAFLKNLSATEGLNISPRNVSLSTCGLVPKIYDLADEGLPVNLTISLHSPTDEGRARTMPIAKKYKISEILAACNNYFEKTGRRYIFEYSLIDGENCDAEHAQKLVALLKGRPCHVNLIRLNAVRERNLSSASQRQANEFLKALTDGGLSATIRRQMGNDIGGACGQLRAKRLKIEE